jgi:NAD(P)H-hydrate epimerase
MQMIPLYTTDQTRELDRQAIEEFGIPGLTLMERAGRVAFDCIMQRYPSAGSVLVLCGSGNNGGDGYVVARLLRQTGIEVRVVTTGAPGTRDAGTVLRRYRDAGGSVTEYEGGNLPPADVIVDGLLGSGLSRAPSGVHAVLIARVNEAGCPVVALDLPSGLSGDSGQAFEPCVRARLTVTFIGRKLGQFTADGPECCGELVFAGLSLEQEILRRVPPAARLTQPLGLPPRPRNSHKGQFGHVVVAGGESGMLGAILLAGRAALRSGAGLVTLLSCSEHLDRPPLLQPELMSREFRPDGDEGAASLLRSATVVVFGPGTTGSSWSEALCAAVRETPLAQVWDAGALHLLADDPDRCDTRVLTPHPGEAAALLGCGSARVQNDRVKAAREIQRKYGGVCVLKGSGTVIASGSALEICDRGNPGMASAGMGDVLSGIIGALLGQGMDPWDAARSGAWWHGAAGDAVRDLFGEQALLAGDLIEQLPAVMRSQE